MPLMLATTGPSHGIIDANFEAAIDSLFYESEADLYGPGKLYSLLKDKYLEKALNRCALQWIKAHSDAYPNLSRANPLKELFPITIELPVPKDQDILRNIEYFKNKVAQLISYCDSISIRLDLVEKDLKNGKKLKYPCRAIVDEPTFFKLAEFGTKRDEFINRLNKAFEINKDLALHLAKGNGSSMNSKTFSDAMASLSWILKNPNPNIYLREAPILGNDSKAFERSLPLMREWLIVCGLVNAISCTDHRQLPSILGFKSKPALIRFSPARQDASLFINQPDLVLRSNELSKIPVSASHVLIVENQETYLALCEKLNNTLLIFGSGRAAASQMRDIQWLNTKEIFYWGDLDSWGFDILAQTRRILSDALGLDLFKVKSVLMDHETLLHCERLLVDEPACAAITPELQESLTDAEYDCLLALSAGRLEQERIPMPWIMANLKAFGIV